MHSKAVAGMLVLGLLGLVGCKQQCFVTECDLEHYRQIGLSREMECTPANLIEPKPVHMAAPATTLFPEREPRHMTLLECISLALENGTIGRQSLNGGSPFADDTVRFGGGTISGLSPVRALALQPAIQATDIDASLAKFDAHWRTSMSWNTTDRPVGSSLDQFQAQTQTAIQLQDANFQTGLAKPLPTGGVANITFGTDYELSNLNPRVNPTYRPNLAFQFQQPLLRNFGVDINQLLTSHPNVAPNGGIAGFNGLTKPVEGILLTRLNFDQQRIEFERQVQIMVVNVEEAYWNLYSAYAGLYSREQSLRQAYMTWRIAKARYDTGRIPIQDLAQVRGQYELVRGQRLSALGSFSGEQGVLERERQLCALLGMPPEDGTRLVPTDAPTVAPFHPDWQTALQEAMDLRPELILARNEVKSRQLQLIREKNFLLPDLRFVSSYDYNALGSRLDGPVSLPQQGGNAFRNLADGKFSNWRLGLELEMPLGFRNEHAAVRAARLELARSYIVLQDAENKTQLFLTAFYRNVFYWYQQIEIQRAQREAYAEQLGALFQRYLAGQQTLDFLLEAQRNWADALRSEYDAIASYNVALAGFQYAKGTIMEYDNVHIAEGPLPACAQVRATEHERQRAAALIKRTRPVPCKSLCSDPEAASFLPDLPAGEAPTVQALMEGGGPLPNNGQSLPAIVPEPARFPITRP